MSNRRWWFALATILAGFAAGCGGGGDRACTSACGPHGTCVVIGDAVGCACGAGYLGSRCETCATGYHLEKAECVPNVVPDSGQSDAETSDSGSADAGQGDTGSQDGGGGDGAPADGSTPDGSTEDGGPQDAGSGDPCAPDNPCTQEHRHVCQNAGGTPICMCDPGFHDESGALCVADTVCNPDTTCAGHGTCTGLGLGCACAGGYTGDHCDQCATGWHASGLTCIKNGPCDSNPCTGQNKTNCRDDGSGGYTCGCDTGYQDNDKDGTCLPTCYKANLGCGQGTICSDATGTAQCVAGTRPPIYISFHWHMHQPIYWPYESIVDTERNNRMGYSIYEIHDSRTGPYTTWPHDAVGTGRSLPHLGAQVSFSGSLMENLNNMMNAGAGFSGWTEPWKEAMGWLTSLGNPRLDLVNFGYHHPLMGLIDTADIRLQLQVHREIVGRVFGARTAKGIFPPECAFSKRMIPAFAAEGIEWSLVDNIHFDRARQDYPYTPGENLPPPNRADAVNQQPAAWVQLNNLWAPSKVSAPWGYQPHYVEYTDPATGTKSRIIAVPAARYEGNEDGRGGFGALQYEAVMSQYEQFNTDPAHPMLVVLHHDGDNYGGGTEGYYHGNFSAFVSWVQSRPDRFVATTIQDYLDQFPPAQDDVIHVEDGSWSGADNGDPEFLKWNGDPGPGGYSPDRNSWAVITAVKNRVLTAEAISAHTSMAAVLDNTGSETDKAWHYMLNAETSCYWYWDNSANGVWDSHPTRAANQAADHAEKVIAGGADTVGPTIYLPQREPYNPGVGKDPKDFTVWTFVYDVSGLDSVVLHYRVDADGVRDAANDLYAGGTWTDLAMNAATPSPQTDPLPNYQADQYSAQVAGLSDVLVDYYVSAADKKGNVSKSPIMHVYVGTSGSGAGGPWTPAKPTKNDIVTVTADKAGKLHWGVNGWTLPDAAYWPANSTKWSDNKAVESPLNGPDGNGKYTVQIGPFDKTQTVTEVDFVFHYGDNTWSNPDQTIPIAP